MSERPVTDETAATARKRERAALERARKVSHVMDNAFRIPGTNVRFGLDPVLGVAPVSGDGIAALASLYVVLQGIRIGVPMRTVGKMLLLVAADFVVGSIPLVGTVLDGILKVNVRNADILESHVEAAYSERDAHVRVKG